MTAKHALIIVAEDWSFLSHRLPLAQTLLSDGYKVSVACRVNEKRQEIENMGFNLIALPLARESISPLSVLSTVWTLVKLYRRLKPSVVIHVSLFLSFLGTMAGLVSGYRRNVNLITGLGFIFISNSAKARLVRLVLKSFFSIRSLSRKTVMVVQNADDRQIFEKMGYRTGRNLYVVRGSGVDDVHFSPAEVEGTRKYVTFVGRMLWAKGVAELVGAARLLKSRNKLPKIILVGEPDPGNPQSATMEDIETWTSDGLVEYWGRRSDIVEIYRQSHIAILPSWREGMPKSLLEAAACGLPLIATDVPGCRELVDHEENGLLVTLKDPVSIADAIEKLMDDEHLRLRMGQNARKNVEEELNGRAIGRKTADIVEKTAAL